MRDKRLKFQVYSAALFMVILMLLSACDPGQPTVGEAGDADIAVATIESDESVVDAEVAAELTATVVVAEATAQAGGDEAIVVQDESATPVPDAAVITPANSGLLTGSDLLDRNFSNADSTVNGEVEDLLLDFSSGRVLFATLEYGGFLDIGDTELPVPLAAFQLGAENNLILNFDEARLEALPDLGQDWPDLTDPGWDDDIVEFWREASVDPGFTFENNTSIIIWLSNLMDRPVGDIGFGEGKVTDILVDVNQSRIKYIVLDYGPLLGDQLVAVPFSAFNTQVYEGNVQLGADLDPDLLSAAPQFGPDALQADSFDRALDEEANRYWTERGFAVEQE